MWNSKKHKSKKEQKVKKRIEEEKRKRERKILEIIKAHEGAYPICIKDLEEQLGYSNALIHRILRKLQREGKIESRKVVWVKGRKVFYQLRGKSWPTYLEKKCRECHNKSTINTCIFHEELAEQGFTCDQTRVKVKLQKNVVACPWFILRVKRRRMISLEKFLAKARKDVGEELPSYHCLVCKETLYCLGKGFLPFIGSSVIRCPNCESSYKLAFDEQREKYMVLFAVEKGEEYHKNFEELAGEPSLEEAYVGARYGIAIGKPGLYQLEPEVEVIISSNWVGRLGELDYIVAKSDEDYYELKKKLEKNYSGITIIRGGEVVISPKPTTQEVAMMRLLRELQVLNVAFCRAILESRIVILEELKEVLDEEERKKAIIIIQRKMKSLEGKKKISPKNWNKLDMNAANAMWEAIANLLEKKGFEFPGRGLGRYVTDPFKKHAYAYGYSEIDAIINAAIKIIDQEIRRISTKRKLCWDGLPGICHGETHGGVLGFHLDRLEPLRLAVIAELTKAIAKGEIIPGEVRYIRGRRRQKIFYIKEEDKIKKKLEEEIAERVWQRKAGKKTLGEEMREYGSEVKNFLEELIAKSQDLMVKHHNQEFAPWAVMEYKLWELLTKEQKRKIEKGIVESMKELAFEPYTLKKN